MPRLPRVDHQEARVETLEQLAARLVDLALVVGGPPARCSSSASFGVAASRREAQETVAAVDRHHRAVRRRSCGCAPKTRA